MSTMILSAGGLWSGATKDTILMANNPESLKKTDHWLMARYWPQRQIVSIVLGIGNLGGFSGSLRQPTAVKLA